MIKRRIFLTGAAAAAGTTFLPFRLSAEGHGTADMFETANGTITVHPVEHASVVLETPAGLVFIDPVGDAAQYEAWGTPDVIFITHEHGDHYNAEVLAALAGESTKLITNPAVFDMMPAELQGMAVSMANGDSGTVGDIGVEAIPAYNLDPEKQNFHPQGRDNGYVLTVDGMRIYVSGDTEDIPEMRALENIDLAFVCMNLPFTMPKEAAADAVNEFAPTYVYPYHYRGRDGGTQDPREFAELVGDQTEVKIGDWYGGEVMPS